MIFILLIRFKKLESLTFLAKPSTFNERMSSEEE